MSEDPSFTQGDYQYLTQTLDGILEWMKEDFGKTDKEANEWLCDFINNHYFPVWRAIHRE